MHDKRESSFYKIQRRYDNVNLIESSRKPKITIAIWAFICNKLLTHHIRMVLSQL